MKKVLKILTSICLLVLALVATKQALADVHTQELVVTKYGLSPGASSFIPSQTRDDGQKINGIPVDNFGNQLSPMPGIHYHVQQIVPTGRDADIAVQNPNPSSYQLIGSPIDIVTDENGVATTNLPDGEYLITEQPNPALRLSQASPPVVVRLPLPGSTGDEVKDSVFLYPKSSVDPPEFVNPKDKGDSKDKSNTESPLPKDSGSNTDDGSQGLKVSQSEAGTNGNDDGKKGIRLFGLELPDLNFDESLLMIAEGLLLFLIIFLLARRKEREKSE